MAEKISDDEKISDAKRRVQHEPTDRNRKMIMVLLALGWSDERIAAAIPCSVSALKKYYAPELKHRTDSRDLIEAALSLQLWLAVEAGNVVAIREFQRLLADSSYRDGETSQLGRPRRVELIRNRIGKKELAELNAQTAGEGSEWGDDLKPPPVN